MPLQSIFGRDTAVNGISQAAKGSSLLANTVGLSDSDSEAGQSDEGGADAEADDLLAAVNGSDEEELGDDEQLEQASTHFDHSACWTESRAAMYSVQLSDVVDCTCVQWWMCRLEAASDHKEACHQHQKAMHICSRSSWG